MSDTLMRQWQMLRLIPRHPAKVCTTELMQHLSDEGFGTTQRTLQRDLIRFSDIYPLICDERSKPFGWSWMKNADVMDIPGMDSHTALAFWLAEKHLEPLLPKVTSDRLQAHFRAATHLLDQLPVTQGMPAWRNKVRVLQRGPNLIAPTINEDVQTQLYDALLRQRRLMITYFPRTDNGEKNYEVNPLGLVFKDGIGYLVCSLWDYSDIRLLVLHRVNKAEILEKTATVPDGFNLDDYIASGELDFPQGKTIKLRALFSSSAAFHLSERPLSEDQCIVEQENHHMLVSATVQDTAELRWWLLGFGDQVEVLKPMPLRRSMAEIADSMAKIYSDN